MFDFDLAVIGFEYLRIFMSTVSTSAKLAFTVSQSTHLFSLRNSHQNTVGDFINLIDFFYKHIYAPTHQQSPTTQTNRGPGD